MKIKIFSDEKETTAAVLSIDPNTPVGIVSQETKIKIKNIPPTLKFPCRNAFSREYAQLENSIQSYFSDRLSAHSGAVIYGNANRVKRGVVEEIAVKNRLSLFDCFLFGKKEERLSDTYRLAQLCAPSVVFVPGASLQRKESIAAAMKKKLDTSFKEKGTVFIVTTADSVGEIDDTLRRPGRLRELDVSVNSDGKRKAVLLSLLDQSGLTCAVDGAEGALAKARGCNDTDLELVVAETVLKTKNNKNLSGAEALLAAMEKHRPQTLSALSVEIPAVKWADIAGNAATKKLLINAVSFESCEKMRRLGAAPGQATLLHGPPGCSKTMLAKALATETGSNFIAVRGPEILSMYVGDSEKRLRDIFHRARLAAPCVLFFDEIDSFGGVRGSDHIGRLTTQLLVEMDGIKKTNDVFVLAATNRIDFLDPALLRPGRFGRHIYVGRPDEEARREMFSMLSRTLPLAGRFSPELFVETTEGMSGAEIKEMCYEIVLSSFDFENHR